MSNSQCLGLLGGGASKESIRAILAVLAILMEYLRTRHRPPVSTVGSTADVSRVKTTHQDGRVERV